MLRPTGSGAVAVAAITRRLPAMAALSVRVSRRRSPSLPYTQIIVSPENAAVNHFFSDVEPKQRHVPVVHDIVLALAAAV